MEKITKYRMCLPHQGQQLVDMKWQDCVITFTCMETFAKTVAEDTVRKFKKKLDKVKVIVQYDNGYDFWVLISGDPISDYTSEILKLD